MQISRLRTLLAFAFALPASAALAADVLVVDRTGQTPGSFTSYAAAIAAAAEGDIVHGLTEGGPIVIDGKGLTVVSSASDTAFDITFSRVEVRDLGPEQTVTIRGLRMMDPNPGVSGIAPATVDLHDNLGTVILDDVSMTAQGLTTAALPMLRIKACAAVVLTECTVQGAFGQSGSAPNPYPVGTALSVSGSNVFVHGGSITGGRGQDGLTVKHPGGPGVLLVSGTLVLAGVEVRGGDGGDATTFSMQCVAGGDGGPGIIANGTLRLLGARVEGGAGGAPFPPLSCPGGAQGADLVQIGGTVTTSDTPLRTMTVDAPVVEGSLATLGASGEPGDLFIALLSTTATPTWIPSLEGVLLTTLPAPLFTLGTLPGSGAVSHGVAATPGTLPAGVEGIPFHLQAIVLDAQGNGWLSTPTSSALIR